MENTFKNKVVNIVSKISYGKTMTYKEVATKAGNPKACRAVGNILNKFYKENFSKNYSFPCHRVIRSDGKTGGYADGENIKEKLLEKESEHEYY
jgi:methylated-DNA-[protein]-cysteine S-methyltransferase